MATGTGLPRLAEEGKPANGSIVTAGVGESTVEPAAGLQRLVSFFILIVALSFGMNILVDAGLERIRTSSFGAWNRVMHGEVNADVIISGSSRAAYHFDPRAIESATGRTSFNIGKAGSQTDVQLAVLRAYIEHNRKPDLVIQNLDAFSFATTQQIYDPAQYVPYLRDRELYQSLHKIDPNLVKSRYIPLYGYVVEDMNFSWFMGLRGLLGWEPKEDYILGFRPRTREWTDEFVRFKEGNPHGVSFAVQPDAVRTMEELIQLCRRNDIELIFVYSPEYREMQAMTNNRAQIFDEFHELSRRYGVPMWDYSDWKYNDDRSYFYNSQHLNANGAAVFSAEFARRLKDYMANRSRSGADARSSAGSVR